VRGLNVGSANSDFWKEVEKVQQESKPENSFSELLLELAKKEIKPLDDKQLENELKLKGNENG